MSQCEEREKEEEVIREVKAADREVEQGEERTAKKKQREGGCDWMPGD